MPKIVSSWPDYSRKDVEVPSLEAVIPEAPGLELEEASTTDLYELTRRKWPTLEALRFVGGTFDDNAVRVVVQSECFPRLRDICFICTPIGPASIRYLANDVDGLPALERVTLSGNQGLLGEEQHSYDYAGGPQASWQDWTPDAAEAIALLAKRVRLV